MRLICPQGLTTDTIIFVKTGLSENWVRLLSLAPLHNGTRFQGWTLPKSTRF